MSRLAVALAALAVLRYGGSAAAQERRASAEIRAVIPGKTLASSTLVGRSGQIYASRAEGGWQRQGRGGIACDVRAAFELSRTLWAVCSRAPLFHHEGGVWSARPLTNRGRTRVARAGKEIVLSIGRHVYVWRGEWKRRSSAPREIKSLHAESLSQMVAVTARGGLLRSRGTHWTQVIAPPDRRAKDADPPARVFGSSKHSYAVSAAGVLSLIDRSSLVPVPLPAGVSAVEIGATAPGADGRVIAAALVTRGSVEEAALATLDGRKIELAPMPPGATGAASAILALGGELLVATRRGEVFVRDRAGVWTRRPLINRAPAAPKTAANGGPARTR